MKLQTKIGLKGYMRATVGKRGETPRVDTGWFPNLITDYGLNAFFEGGTNLVNRCKVGAGSTPPTVTDTQLESFIAMEVNPLEKNTPAPFDVGTMTANFIAKWRFDEGEATGNIAEIGIADASDVTNNYRLFSRALVKDAFGDPTVITVLADEVLDVTYSLIYQLPATDFVTTLDIAGVSTTITVRPSDVDGTSSWYFPLNMGLVGGYARQNAHTQEIQTVTGIPSGRIEGDGTFTELAYVQDSFEKKMIIDFNNAAANTPGGFPTIVVSTGGRWQIGFSPYVAKTEDQVFSMDYTISWGRL